ncbi:hypothetical protein ACIGO8_05595 [Streptomyces sp. NPDC053493]|uniref:hypothetical protein n=1 Tax=Streptomyces sp. NPDC053493 TaxID=3365705 RepID=UPI0037CEE365
MAASEERSFGRMIVVSMLVLFLEAALALVLATVFGDTRAPEPGEERVNAYGVVLLPFAVLLAPLPVAAVSAALVVPSVLLGEHLAARLGGPLAGWQLLLPAVAGALSWPLAGWRGWLVAAACLAVAALIARHARRGFFVSVLVRGTVVVLAVFALGGVGVYAGVID